MRRGLVTALSTVMLLAGAPAMTDAASRPGHAARRRSWQVSLRAPAPAHYVLAKIGFRARAGAHARVTLGGPIGADYVASARLRTVGEKAQILVFVLDRATALMDPARIDLRVRLSSPASAPNVLEAPEGFPSGAADPALCDLRLKESDLRPLSASGGALGDYSAVGAIYQAFDATCSLPYQAAFERAVRQTPMPSPSPPAPIPPVGPPPGCQPCTAPPGYACPLLARPSVCVASSTTARRAAQPAH